MELIWRILWVAGYVLLAPLLGGLLAGFDRKISARMQGRKGPSVWQPFYDLFKLFKKQSVVVNNVQDFLVYGFLLSLSLPAGFSSSAEISCWSSSP